jgi:hypothetical protein
MTARQFLNSNGWFRSRNSTTLLVLLAIAAVFVLKDHKAHVLAALPYLVLLLCPVLHFFMPGRHGKHGGGSGEGDPSS